MANIHHKCCFCGKGHGKKPIQITPDMIQKCKECNVEVLFHSGLLPLPHWSPSCSGCDCKGNGGCESDPRSPPPNEPFSNCNH